jgi:hypothetical protein
MRLYLGWWWRELGGAVTSGESLPPCRAAASPFSGKLPVVAEESVAADEQLLLPTAKQERRQRTVVSFLLKSQV